MKTITIKIKNYRGKLGLKFNPVYFTVQSCRDCLQRSMKTSLFPLFRVASPVSHKIKMIWSFCFSLQQNKVIYAVGVFTSQFVVSLYGKDAVWRRHAFLLHLSAFSISKNEHGVHPCRRGDGLQKTWRLNNKKKSVQQISLLFTSTDSDYLAICFNAVCTLKMPHRALLLCYCYSVRPKK